MRENINLATEYNKDTRQLNALIKWSDFMEGFNMKSSTNKLDYVTSSEKGLLVVR